MNTSMVIVGVLILALGGYLFYASRRLRNMSMGEESKNLLHFTDSNFDKEIKSGVTLVDFWASWCMPCKILIPIMNDLANDMEGKAKIGKLNVDEQQKIAMKYNIRSIPTVLVFKNGKEINRIVGVKPNAYYQKEILKIL